MRAKQKEHEQKQEAWASCTTRSASGLLATASASWQTKNASLLAAVTSIFLPWSLNVAPVIHEGLMLACNINTTRMRTWILGLKKGEKNQES
jgi:hypothetical protein